MAFTSEASRQQALAGILVGLKMAVLLLRGVPQVKLGSLRVKLVCETFSTGDPQMQ